MVDIKERNAGLEDVLGYLVDEGNRWSLPTLETNAMISIQHFAISISVDGKKLSNRTSLTAQGTV